MQQIWLKTFFHFDILFLLLKVWKKWRIIFKKNFMQIASNAVHKSNFLQSFPGLNWIEVILIFEYNANEF